MTGCCFSDPLEESPETATPVNLAAEMLKQGAGELIIYSNIWLIWALSQIITGLIHTWSYHHHFSVFYVKKSYFS